MVGSRNEALKLRAEIKTVTFDADSVFFAAENNNSTRARGVIDHFYACALGQFPRAARSPSTSTDSGNDLGAILGGTLGVGALGGIRIFSSSTSASTTCDMH